MGYSYGMNPNTGRVVLACDFCGACDSTARKMRCPAGYCPAVATCSACYKAGKHKHSPEQYRKCKGMSIEYERKRQKERDIIASGIPLRHAALAHGDETRVLFSTKKRSLSAGEKQTPNAISFYVHMPHETYDAVPLGIPATLDDYKAVNPEGIRIVDVKDLYEPESAHAIA